MGHVTAGEWKVDVAMSRASRQRVFEFGAWWLCGLVLRSTLAGSAVASQYQSCELPEGEIWAVHWMRFGILVSFLDERSSWILPILWHVTGQCLGL